MRRADRLFQIVQHLRRHRTSGRLTTAQALADELEVSVRTIYRDMDDLSASGVPIIAAPGRGYGLMDGYDLPPLMFSRDELAALLLGARMVQTWSDPVMAKAAEDLIGKVDAVIPASLRGELARWEIAPLRFSADGVEKANLARLREMIRDRRKARFAYLRLDGQASERQVRPLGLFFWGKVWTLGAWCELRGALRSFRVDRIKNIDDGDLFDDEPGKTLEDYIASSRRECDERDE